MNAKLKKAKEILIANEYTCVLFDGDNIYYSQKRGVKPLIEFLESKTDFSNYCAADKVIGAGAAHLYVLLGVKHVWAGVVSSAAKSVLEANDISVTFENTVPHIINRTGDGICPIEQCVNGISDSDLALKKIKTKLKEMP